MSEPLTYEELQQFAMEHYNKGGSIICECWSEKDFAEIVAESGPITKEKALKMFEAFEDKYPNLCTKTSSPAKKTKFFDEDISAIDAGTPDNDDYILSSTHGDYSPSAPWKAPGMTVDDFI